MSDTSDSNKSWKSIKSEIEVVQNIESSDNDLY